MTRLGQAVETVTAAQKKAGKPLAVILAGHNGSGKSTLWYARLSERFQIPLVNADQMMLSILPDRKRGKPLVAWARKLRDEDPGWMRVAQKGVDAFVVQAMSQKVPFAVETVFSYWIKRPRGGHASKIDLIKKLQKNGYFVLLVFVGLSSANLSIARVETRVKLGGHAVQHSKLTERFPRTQQAIRAALRVADAVVLTDNSRGKRQAFTVCTVQLDGASLFDVRQRGAIDPRIQAWLSVVCPQG